MPTLNPFAPQACTTPFARFDHSSQADVLLREELDAARRNGEPLSSATRRELVRLMRRARPPIYPVDDTLDPAA